MACATSELNLVNLARGVRESPLQNECCDSQLAQGSHNCIPEVTGLQKSIQGAVVSVARSPMAPTCKSRAGHMQCVSWGGQVCGSTLAIDRVLC